MFYSPENLRQRVKLQGFMDAFKALEASYTRLLEASDADGAGAEWDNVCAGLKARGGEGEGRTMEGPQGPPYIYINGPLNSDPRGAHYRGRPPHTHTPAAA